MKIWHTQLVMEQGTELRRTNVQIGRFVIVKNCCKGWKHPSYAVFSDANKKVRHFVGSFNSMAPVMALLRAHRFAGTL